MVSARPLPCGVWLCFELLWFGMTAELSAGYTEGASGCVLLYCRNCPISRRAALGVRSAPPSFRSILTGLDRSLDFGRRRGFAFK